MSKRNTKDHPPTKGGALIQVRKILGPNARVWCMLDPLTCFVDSGPGSSQIAMGYSWDKMVQNAKDTPEAFRAKVKEYLKDSRLMKLFNRSEVKYVLGGLKVR